MAMLVGVLGLVPAAVALGVTAALIPASTEVARRLAALRKDVVAATDARVKLTAEVVNGIKAVKLYGWEAAYVDRIDALRAAELAATRRAAIVGIASSMVFGSAPVLISIGAFGAYAATGRPLTPDVAFPALSLFNLLRFPVMMLPNQVANLVAGGVAFDRIQSFLEDEEVTPPPAAPAAAPGTPAIALANASFAWHRDGAPTLSVPSLTLPSGALALVVGPVGAGKSSLLAALLGEMHKVSGRLSVAGRVAYAAQEPWIFNGTVRQNVLGYGSPPLLPSRTQFYDAVLDAACLRPDLADLTAGDGAEIGERGVNLSGGQRARVALARAAFADADVLLMDDPLAAVDAHVGAALWAGCVQGLLKGKTRVVVTHHVHVAPTADIVIVVRGGAVVAVGSPADLAARGVDLGAAVADDGESAESAAPPTPPPAPPTPQPALVDVPDAALADAPDGDAVEAKGGGKAAPPAPPPPNDKAFPPPAASASARIVATEARATGRVERAIYRTYLAAWGAAGPAGASLPLPAAVVGLAALERGLQVSQNVWLAYWSDGAAAAAGGGTGAVALPASIAAGTYAALGAASIAMQAVRAYATVVGSLAAAASLHAALLARVVRLPMSFFDAQPSGRLVNRFSKDVEALDVALGEIVQSALTCFVNVLFALAVAVAVAPAVGLLAVPLAAAYWRVQAQYIAASREVKRLDSVALSPVFGAFGEVLAGAATLRAARAGPAAAALQRRLLNASTRTYWPMRVLDRWLSVRLELLANGVVLGAGLLVALASPASAGVAGLALTSALSLTGLLNWAVRKATDLEVNMNAVERVTEYASVPTEAAAIIPASRPPPGWPAAGAVDVSGLVVRYRAGLDPVLRGLTFSIPPHTKVGVCGRTGCGKSTLTLALFRVVEPASGRVVIDGVDTATIGLADLRRGLCLVPQEPVVFSGTIRSNLDPFGDAPGGDAALWSALERAALAPAARALGGLDAAVAEAGGTLSHGERQLLCMARALARGARLLILDEATSAVDERTDARVQATVRSAFAGATVLTIAHRLHTIADADTLLVLDAGAVAEQGPPRALLADAGSRFRALVDAARAGREAGGVGRAESAADLLAGLTGERGGGERGGG